MFPELTKYNGVDPTGFYMSEKLNGVKARWTGSEFISKNGKPFAVPFDFKRNMPGTPIDGELYANGDLGRIAGLCRRKLSAYTEWEGVTFQVFDTPSHSHNFADRLDVIAGLTLPAHVQAVQQTICRDADQFHKMFQRIKAAGGEGVVGMSALHMYRPGQSIHAFKAKYLDDFEVNGCTFDETGRFICVRDYE